ncbi:hypothetical protein ACQ4LE_002760 [Meloidogyne hapla]|uniref:LITAF domain-containing protein n=1 Tax=Meloidogyne hapla TaxID=6305 RepID=A0A1I8BGT5_MELHA
MNNNDFIQIAPFNPAIPPPEIPTKIRKRESTLLDVIPPKVQKIETTSTEFKKPNPPKQTLWKLFRGKFLLTFYLCSTCRDRLFTCQEKITNKDDRVVVKIDLCSNCVKKNCMATDLLAPYNKK